MNLPHPQPQPHLLQFEFKFLKVNRFFPFYVCNCVRLYMIFNLKMIYIYIIYCEFYVLHNMFPKILHLEKYFDIHVILALCSCLKIVLMSDIIH